MTFRKQLHIGEETTQPFPSSTAQVIFVRCDCTANASKLIEKHFLDLRNMFSNQENIRIFSQNKKNELAKKNFLVPSARKFDLN